MMRSTRQRCPHAELVRALARGELTGDDSSTAESHLSTCEPCRGEFRHESADRYPRFKGYTIVGILGRGGFGTVYKALHHAKARFEALKVLFAETTVREAYFQNEVRLVARLRHPHIATLYDAQLSGSPMFYTMEYVRGQHLDAYLREHDVPLERRIAILKGVAEAIGYAHQQGIAHRDLKPQNILIDELGQPRIVDFGIGKRLGLIDQRTGARADGAESPGGVLGTYGYIAPEQRDARPVDARADIYALGALLFHVVTGEPAKFATRLVHLRSVLKQQGLARSDDLAAIIARCVATEPDSRYADTHALIDDLDRFIAGRTVRARTDAPVSYKLARVSAYLLRNHPAAVAVTTLVIIATLMSLGAVGLGIRAPAAMTPAERPPVALIAFTPTTVEAIRAGQIGTELAGLSADDRKSWRLLYGLLMERLAAAKPCVVAWDMYFGDCQPDYDPALIRGVRALKAPVLVLAQDTDVNDEPLLCAAIREAVWGWGVTYAYPLDAIKGEFLMSLARTRGFNPPSLALPVMVRAAARHPDAVPEATATEGRLNIRYRLRAPAEGASRWHADTDELSIYDVETVEYPSRTFRAGDKLYQARFRTDEILAWATRTIAAERALTADDATLRAWFGGKVILIGRQIPGEDQHALSGGETVYGSQAVAAAIEDVLSQMQLVGRDRWRVAAWVVLWCAAGGFAGWFAPAAFARRPGPAVCAAVLVCVAAGVGGTISGADLPNRLWSAVLIAGGAALSATAAAWFVRILHRRQLQLLPTPLWGDTDTGDASTVVAPERPRNT
jgi:hypothetical protein